MERMTSPNIDNQKTAILEKTLALIKPDGMQFREAIMKRIRRAGFAILQVYSLIYFLLIKLTLIYLIVKNC